MLQFCCSFGVHEGDVREEPLRRGRSSPSQSASARAAPGQLQRAKCSSPKHNPRYALHRPTHIQDSDRKTLTRSNMNWTGGSLQRTKKANTGVVQQQKAYFARARTQLQNDTNSPVAPFRPSYLQDDGDSYLLGIAPSGSGSLRHTGHAAKRRNERTQPEHTPGNYQPTAKRRETTPHGESHPNDRLTHKGSSDGSSLTCPSDRRY